MTRGDGGGVVHTDAGDVSALRRSARHVAFRDARLTNENVFHPIVCPAGKKRSYCAEER
jgi:hypothetical protein